MSNYRLILSKPIEISEIVLNISRLYSFFAAALRKRIPHVLVSVQIHDHEQREHGLVEHLQDDDEIQRRLNERLLGLVLARGHVPLAAELGQRRRAHQHHVGQAFVRVDEAQSFAHARLVLVAGDLQHAQEHGDERVHGPRFGERLRPRKQRGEA